MKEVIFLKRMVQQVNARRILELGTFDGTSALAMAECLPDDGELITCEINSGLAGLARKRAGRHAHGHKVDVRTGPALETLPHLAGPFDLIFIDADTQNYVHYFHLARELLAPSGVLLIDNMRASELVLSGAGYDSNQSAVAIRELAQELATDPKLDAQLAHVRDGVMVITPKAPANRSS
jgi:caffeoyl-CoA O-methyltransferase